MILWRTFLIRRYKINLNPYRDIVSKISPTDFEEYCIKILTAYAECENLKDFSITHNEKIKTADGEYQIDIYAEFVAISVKFKVLVECKRYSRPVEREKVVLLSDKVRSVGANKGVLISTSGFQSGTVEYAKIHGISLIQIFDKHIMHIQASASSTIDTKRLEFINQSPPYYAYQWGVMMSDFPDKKIYPTTRMDMELKERINEHYE